MTTPISLDGSTGEGGGQVLRSALTLSMITGQTFEIKNIRSKRSKPGLLHQHLTAVRAARTICGGGVTGDELGSSEIIFAPGPIENRDFQFDVGSAGSATLIAQTLIPALMLGTKPSSIEIVGGTHNRAAPPFDYLQRVYLPLVARLGPKFKSELHSWGFYPRGGGKISIEIEPSETLLPLSLDAFDERPQPRVLAVVSQLPLAIAEREAEYIRRQAGWRSKQCEVLKVDNSPGPGNVVMIELKGKNMTELFTGFGQIGIPAEKVAAHAWSEARQYLIDQVPVGEHLGDQLLLPLALAAVQGSSCSFTTGPLSGHSHTHIDVIRRFLPVQIQVKPQSANAFQVVLSPLPA